MRARARIRVFGMVQGVFFRHSTSLMAKKLGVAGYVRNMEDGSVEAVYEGEKQAVEDIVEWTKKGPPYARVESFQVTWEEPKGEFEGFSVRH